MTDIATVAKSSKDAIAIHNLIYKDLHEERIGGEKLLPIYGFSPLSFYGL